MICKHSFSRQIAEYLLKSQAVTLKPDEPFTWSSGWKSPIYCDNRLILSFPDIRIYVFAKLKEVFLDHFSSSRAIAGVATAGIPAASAIAHDLHLPMVYVRSSAKKHGRQNMIEGRLEAGSKCLIIEDLISTGGSSLQAADALEAENIEVTGILSVFTYGFEEAKNAISGKGYPYLTLCDYNTLIEVAIEQNYVEPNQLQLLEDWRKNPATWGK